MNITNDWRDDACSVKDRLKYTLTNDNTQQDVVIVAGCGLTETKIKAHSFMLFIGSQVLEKFLEQAKMNNEGMKEIQLPSIRPEAMKNVLQFIYNDSFDVQYENTLDILYASVKLNVNVLVALCVAKLKDELSAANALRVFEESAKMNVEELVQCSQKYILKNAGEVFLEEQFLNISHESLGKLLACDELELDEISIFNSTIRWARAQCNRLEMEGSSDNLRFLLKNVVSLIRFTLMPIQEFASIVVPTNILDDKEVADVYTYLVLKSSPPGQQIDPPVWISSCIERTLTYCGEIASSTHSNSPSTSQSENGGSLQQQIESKILTKHKLLQFLRSISGKNTVSGLFVELAEDADSIDTVQTFQKITGMHPGLLSLTMPSYLDRKSVWRSFTRETISKWNNGYLVLVSWWDNNHPLTQLEISTVDDNKWKDLINDDGQLNREWKKRLDAIVPYLQQLQNAGVVVIWDILPLMNCDIYFWGGRPGMNGSLKLYQITHDYMTQKHQLHSLLWVWSFDPEQGSAQLDEFWPGNNYVDVASAYVWDKKQLEMDMYQKLLEIVGDKPISMEEVYTVLSPEILNLQPRWTWFTTPEHYLKHISSNNSASIKTTFRSLSIINKENNEFFKTCN